LGPISSQLFNQKLKALEQQKADEVVSYKCASFSKSFSSAAAYKQHMSSKKHQKKVNSVSKTGTPKSSQPMPSDGSEIVPMSSEVENKETNNSVVITENSTDTGATMSEDQGHDGVETETEEKNGIALKTCLFCSRTGFYTVQASLDHMLKEHGFFIPFVEILKDLEGLLLYLGEKIGIGHVCIYCNGRGKAAYSSEYAVQQHMRSKDHCKIRFEEDEEDDEFIEFYDFPTEEIEDESKEIQDTDNAEVTTTRTTHTKQLWRTRTATVTESGELDIGNGKLLGHRSLQNYYKQNLRPGPTPMLARGIEHVQQHANPGSALVAQLSGQYRSLMLPGYNSTIPGIVDKTTEKAYKKFLRIQQKRSMQNGVAANKLQHHYRDQVMY